MGSVPLSSKPSPVWEVIEPYLTAVGAYTISDPTYGRWNLPHHPPHLDLIDDPAVKHSFHRIFLPETPLETTEILASEPVELKASELTSDRPSNRWLVYSIWEMQEPEGGWEEGGKGLGKDLVLAHGLSDYGLRYAPHVKHFMRAGFRVVIPDLPSYGRSTGINSLLPSARLLTAALHVVLTDVVRSDLAAGTQQRKVCLSGASMGGWTALYYLSQYPPTSSPVKAVEDKEEFRIQIAGAFILCPMISVSADSRPWKVTEYIGRGIRYFAGALPLAKSLRGKVSDDPRVEEDFFADPLCYHGWLRVATGFALLEGMNELVAKAEEINVPIRLIHGSADRVTSPKGTQGLFERLPHKDKSMEIFDGYEHVMIKVGIDEADDAKRQRVLRDWRGWLVDRC